MYRSMSILFTVKSSRPENRPLNSTGFDSGSLTNSVPQMRRRTLADEIGGRRPACIRAVREAHDLLRVRDLRLAALREAVAGPRGGRTQEEPDRFGAHRIEGRRMVPLVGAHDLVIDGSGQQRRRWLRPLNTWSNHR